MNTQNIGILDVFQIIVQKNIHENAKIDCRIYLDTLM